MDALKAEWLRAPDQESRKSVATTMQRHAFDALPFVPPPASTFCRRPIGAA